MYLREMAQKIRRGLAGQLDRGYSTGATRFGYRAMPELDPNGRPDSTGRPALLGKRLKVVPEEADIIRRIFELYAGGVGVPSIVDRLNRLGSTARGRRWDFGAVRRLLRNERLTGKDIWGQRRFERRPGTRQKVARAVPRAEWRVMDRPDLRIVSDELWNAVQSRLLVVGRAQRQAASGRMRGRNAALYSRHLFSGFLRCGACDGAITVVTGGTGSPRYGCLRHSKNGASACGNRLTIRARIADAVLLEGLQAELLRPETVATISGKLSAALNAYIEQRPHERARLIRARADSQAKLQNLVAAVEAGAGTTTLFAAITEREAEIRTLDAQLASPEEPLTERLAVMPTWVQRQLESVSDLLREGPERAKAEFQRLSIQFKVTPVYDEGPRPFLRAEGSGHFEHLAFSQYTNFTTRDRSNPRSEP